jgi:hypothetical protein
MTAVATHLVMSFAQTLMHYELGHHPIGGKFFRNHINFAPPGFTDYRIDKIRRPKACAHIIAPQDASPSPDPFSRLSRPRTMM